ncbi:hypothetical protein [Modestobacter sp. NPDC049651]|uniref:hypothetical protein n=1 Tax=unclassified Modestobacter TaxID=2643866 RepID=UPI0033D049E9
MSGLFDKARAKAEELLGRAEEVYGESHGDAAAEAAGEARRLEGEAEEERAAAEEAARRQHGGDGGRTS